MTRKELEFILKILVRIKPQDSQVDKAIALIDKDLALYNARKGQLKEQYSYSDSLFNGR